MALLDKLKPASTNIDTALSRLDEKSLELNRFQGIVNSKEQKLDELHNQDAETKTIARAEAELTKAIANRDRAIRSLDVAKKRFSELQKAEHEKVNKQNIKIRNEALKRRVAAAKKLDDVVETLEEIVSEFTDTDKLLHIGQQQKVVSWAARGMYGASKTKSIIYQSLFKANIPGASEFFTGVPRLDHMKTAVEQVKYANDTMVLENERRPMPKTDEPKLVFTSEPETEKTSTQVTEQAPVDTRPKIQVQPSEKQVNYGKKKPDQDSSLLGPTVEGEVYRA